jgi:hypothetical protein
MDIDAISIMRNRAPAVKVVVEPELVESFRNIESRYKERGYLAEVRGTTRMGAPLAPLTRSRAPLSIVG